VLFLLARNSLTNSPAIAAVELGAFSEISTLNADERKLRQFACLALDARTAGT